MVEVHQVPGDWKLIAQVLTERQRLLFYNVFETHQSDYT